MMIEADLVIIGAGPAGMAAAAQAAKAGISVLILDEQPRAGGQIYRDVTRVAALRGAILGPDYVEGGSLVAGLDHPRITHLSGAMVWRVDNGGIVAFGRSGVGGIARGKRLLIATGALERPMPIPGWTLPGVMTAGAAQVLLKASGIVAESSVLAGSGPLIYLVAAQMVRAGTPPLALVETQTATDAMRAMRHLPGALVGWRALAKGVRLLAELRSAGVPRFTGASNLRVHGESGAEAVEFLHKGRLRRIDCRSVFLHHGVVPNTQMTRALDLGHDWHGLQRSFQPQIDQWGRSSLPDIFVAGDGAGIGGARVAAYAGSLAALEIACDLGAITLGDRDLAARPLRTRRRIETAVRPFLDTIFPPFPEAIDPADETIICRCEEVTAGAIRQYSGLGCQGPNQTKAFSRVGMGPCQGRYCGSTVTEILAVAHGKPQAEIGAYRIRPPLKPVTLAEIASIASAAPTTE